MSQRKKQGRHKQAKQSSVALGKRGFDYALTPNVAALGSIDFNQKLRDAEVVGVAYGYDYSQQLKQPLPAFTLIVRKEQPLRDAFAEFARWTQFSDADAIDVTFFFLQRGGYRLIIGAEPRALMQRTLRFDAVYTPIAFQVSWIKPVDSTSQPLIDLSKQLGKGIRPFLLNAALYPGADRAALGPSSLVHISGLPELLKFKVRFLHEGDGNALGWQAIAVPDQARRHPRNRGQLKKQRSGLPTKQMLYSFRTNRLRTLFPVTLWRAGQSTSIKIICGQAVEAGVVQWQIDQAVCNAVLSRELCGAAHFSTIVDAWPKALLDRLQNRFEVGDCGSFDFATLSVEEILEQVRLDATVLLDAYGERTHGNDFPSVIKSLRRSGFLDIPV